MQLIVTETEAMRVTWRRMHLHSLWGQHDVCKCRSTRRLKHAHLHRIAFCSLCILRTVLILTYSMGHIASCVLSGSSCISLRLKNYSTICQICSRLPSAASLFSNVWLKIQAMAEIVQDLTKYIQKLEEYVEDTLCQISWKLIFWGNMLQWLSKHICSSLNMHVQLETRN